MSAHPRRKEDRRIVEREVDIALGLVTAGMLAGRKAARAGLAPARVAYRSPLGTPWRGLVAELTDSGGSTRGRGLHDMIAHTVVVHVPEDLVVAASPELGDVARTPAT
jgi:hypothetical protein